MKKLSDVSIPVASRRFHGWATIAWLAASLPLAIMYGSSVIFVTFLSLYAIVTGHWSSWQASRVEVKQEQDADVQEVVDKLDNDVLN